MAARFQYTPQGGSTLSHRAALIPPDRQQGAEPSSGRSSPFGAFSNARTAEELESQNEDALEGLSAKVKILKDVRVGLRTPLRLA
jgi:blocked-early-in-transport protein 1